MLDYLFVVLVIEVALVVAGVILAIKGKSKKAAVALIIVGLLIGILGVSVNNIQKSDVKNNYIKVAGCFTADEEGYPITVFCDLYKSLDSGKLFVIEDKFGFMIFHEVELSDGYEAATVRNGYDYVPYFNGNAVYKIAE